MKQFEVKSGKIVASDPCYSLDTWCMAIIENVRNGTWFAFADTIEKPGWGKRISALVVYHADTLKVNPNILSLYHLMPKLPFVGGVDSGQFGFFDFDAYRNSAVITSEIPLWEEFEEKDGGKFYSACCHQTLETPEHWGVLPFGAVSTSGYGDGSYDILGEKNSYGEYTAFAVMFIDESPEDEDEDDNNDDEFPDDEDDDD